MKTHSIVRAVLPAVALAGGGASEPLRSGQKRLSARLAGILALLLAAWPGLAAAADDDLPGRVARLSEPNGEVLLAPNDKPDEWVPIGVNYPITGGDNLWVGADGRAEVDYGGGQFRMSAGTNLHVSRLDDTNFALFVAQGRVIIRVRALEPGESAVVDAPNAQVVLTRTGLYRIEVTEDRLRTLLIVREGEANVYVGGAVQQVLPGQTATIDGFEPRYAAVARTYGQDGFDTWSNNRDRRYDRRVASANVSSRMVGYADLDEYGTWQQAPEYGQIWYPNSVAPDWAPYRFGYWTNVGAWGSTWVDNAPWGYAPFHYGRWAFVGGRWGWCPGAFVARPVWAPALVGWVGGPGWNVSVVRGAPVYGWVPLGWGEAYRPGWGNCGNRCWERYNRPYAVNVAQRPSGPPARYANGNVPGAISAMPENAFVSRRSVQSNLVAVPVQGGGPPPTLAAAPLVRTSPGRIPGARIGEGLPPPASTFYPTITRPGGPGGPGGLAPRNGIAGTPVAPTTKIQEVPRPGMPAQPAPGGLVRQSPTPLPTPTTNTNPTNTFQPRSAPPGSPSATGPAGAPQRNLGVAGETSIPPPPRSGGRQFTPPVNAPPADAAPAPQARRSPGPPQQSTSAVPGAPPQQMMRSSPTTSQPVAPAQIRPPPAQAAAPQAPGRPGMAPPAAVQPPAPVNPPRDAGGQGNKELQRNRTQPPTEGNLPAK